ncbi:exported hypothetical protein [Candidatus Sulfopaludibacter sp. SbA3]|nr:exported hypothetical protein [Candidatus Sulfopaludibacter sp. SbA3]
MLARRTSYSVAMAGTAAMAITVTGLGKERRAVVFGK